MGRMRPFTEKPRVWKNLLLEQREVFQKAPVFSCLCLLFVGWKSKNMSSVWLSNHLFGLNYSLWSSQRSRKFLKKHGDCILGVDGLLVTTYRACAIHRGVVVFICCKREQLCIYCKSDCALGQWVAYCYRLLQHHESCLSHFYNRCTSRPQHFLPHLSLSLLCLAWPIYAEELSCQSSPQWQFCSPAHTHLPVPVWTEDKAVTDGRRSPDREVQYGRCVPEWVTMTTFSQTQYWASARKDCSLFVGQSADRTEQRVTAIFHWLEILWMRKNGKGGERLLDMWKIQGQHMEKRWYIFLFKKKKGESRFASDSSHLLAAGPTTCWWPARIHIPSACLLISGPAIRSFWEPARRCVSVFILESVTHTSCALPVRQGSMEQQDARSCSILSFCLSFSASPLHCW